MPQIAFFGAGASAPAGALALLLAWDRRDRGASAADDIDAPFDGEVGLYTLLVPTVGAQLVRAKSRAPIGIPEEGWRQLNPELRKPALCACRLRALRPYHLPECAPPSTCNTSPVTWRASVR